MRPLLLPIALLAACPKDDHKDTTMPPIETADTGLEGACVPATITGSSTLTCADPSTRNGAHFLHKRAVSPALPVANQTSAGMAVGDVDGDGLLDLFVANELGSQLWRNVGDNLWDQQSDPFQGADLSMAVGAVVVDYDGDGDLDLCVTRWQQPNALLENDGTGTFTDVTPTAGIGLHSWRTQSSSWADVDLDGDLDVYFGSYGPKPETYDSANVPADPGEFYINNGDGTFTDRSDLIHADVHDGYAFSSAFYDTNGDGYPELFQFNDFGKTSPARRSRMLINNFATDGGFLTDELDNGIDRDFEDMGIGVADLNGDRLPDFAITSWKETVLLNSNASLGWIKTQDVIVVDPKNRNQVYGWGADFGDVDNDGDLDLAMAFGYWSVYDGAGDPPVQVDGLWIQDDAGGFENLAAEPEWGVNDKGMGRGVLLVDVNDDGYLDLLKRELDEASPTLQHLSQCGDASFLRVELRQPGANSRAIGATIEVLREGSEPQLRWIHAGSASLFVGHPPEAHFGLGTDREVGLRITWPDGACSELDAVTTGQRIIVER